ncbi:hypothetical protein BsWGS_21068 [Bradybaena similaris]
MVMETPGPQEVGREFVRQYYTMLHEAPLHLHRFYSNNSAFVHGGVEVAGCEQPPVIGQEAIHKKIVSLNFNDCHAKIRQVDSQATVEDSVVVQVTGELSNNGEPMRRFMQTFVLVPQTPKKFYVHNDIFRYQDEVFHDEESEAEEDHTAFIIDPREETLDNGSIQERVSAGPEVTANYYLQEPVSNGPVHEIEALKGTEPVPPVVTSSQSMKAQVDVAPEPEPSDLEEAPVEEVDRFEPKVEPKPVPVVEPPQPEFHEPQPEAKPVTWAALASKNAAGGLAPVSNTNLTHSPGQVGKPPPARNEPPKPEGVPSQAPQSQRAPRPPRDRVADRDKNSVSRVDSDGDADSVNGRRSNSVGGGSRYSDSQQLFVGNLPQHITERELKEFFEQYGNVEELRINTKSSGGKVPNFGFVVFENADTVQKILKIKATQPIKYNNEHRLNVEEKKPRSSESIRGRCGMGRGGGPGFGGRSGGQGYSAERGGAGGRGGMKSGGGGFNNRQDMRGSPSLGPRGGFSQQGRR